MSWGREGGVAGRRAGGQVPLRPRGFRILMIYKVAGGPLKSAAADGPTANKLRRPGDHLSGTSLQFDLESLRVCTCTQIRIEGGGGGYLCKHLDARARQPVITQLGGRARRPGAPTPTRLPRHALLVAAGSHFGARVTLGNVTIPNEREACL
ncbi:hypothetical protein EVAR_62319_1 [Eumeta japonica]|uniref:SWIM-type domain-containing protein n=1 Tax=Eumeta variegata TaxID=151549 RepID=A0A4C1ZIC8_EUMVA|nr:hypothetical protein EVAR_62319_1 [Eumeta japonica]